MQLVVWSEQKKILTNEKAFFVIKLFYTVFGPAEITIQLKLVAFITSFIKQVHA